MYHLNRLWCAEVRFCSWTSLNLIFNNYHLGTWWWTSIIANICSDTPNSLFSSSNFFLWNLNKMWVLVMDLSLLWYILGFGITPNSWSIYLNSFSLICPCFFFHSLFDHFFASTLKNIQINSIGIKDLISYQFLTKWCTNWQLINTPT